MSDPAWYSILPPVLAIVLAIWSKQVILSLFAGIWMGHTLLNQFNPLAGIVKGLDGTIEVFTDPGDARVLVFTLLIGPLIATKKVFFPSLPDMDRPRLLLERTHWCTKGCNSRMDKS